MNQITKLFPRIDGEYVETSDLKTEQIHSPWSQEPICEIFLGTQATADKAIKSSKKAFEQIEDREYAAKFLNKNKPVTIAGLNYNVKKRTIDTDWLIKKLR